MTVDPIRGNIRTLCRERSKELNLIILDQETSSNLLISRLVEFERF